jgi:aquaporin Z
MYQQYVAEFLGTFLLVFFGCGAAALYSKQPTAGLSTSLAFGVVLAMLIIIFALLSGANFNPAVSLGLAMNGKLSYGEMSKYWIFQVLGAIAAAALLYYLIGPETGLGASIGPLTTEAPWKAVIVEAILTFVLVYVVLTVVNNSDYDTIAPLAIGLALMVGVLVGYNLTGGSLNPARSIGPALFTKNLGTIWIYILGPLVGGGVAALLYKYLH